MEHYIVIEKGPSPNSATFVIAEEGKLERVAGDSIIFGLMEIKDGNPVMSERAILSYDITPIDKSTFDFTKKIYEEEAAVRGIRLSSLVSYGRRNL